MLREIDEVLEQNLSSLLQAWDFFKLCQFRKEHVDTSVNSNTVLRIK